VNEKEVYPITETSMVACPLDNSNISNSPDISVAAPKFVPRTTTFASANGKLVSLSTTMPEIVTDCENKKPKNNE
jgi:hypothetical protein|tara:strand:- start:26944 stop:27168 length:225 start_codon:yes stop_codon:yes gene_type:complete